MALADLGSAELLAPRDRIRWKPRREETTLEKCTRAYRPPDVFLGNTSFGADLDMWSFGCVAAELFRRRMLFHTEETIKLGGKHHPAFLRAHLAFLGTPPEEAERWLTHLPYFYAHFPRGIPRSLQPKWPGQGWLSCPAQLTDLVQQVLRWPPSDRLSAASARRHPFLATAPLPVTVSVKQGKHGLGSIAEGFIDDEVLEYLQQDPVWAQVHAECLRGHSVSTCMSASEAALAMKSEFVGYVDADLPPKTRRLNADVNLGVVRSARTCNFVKALRRVLKPWLHQLTLRIRAAFQRQGMPAELMSNGVPFTEKDLADNAFVYATVQALSVAEREDGWHTDGGASLLHAGLTVFGTRKLLVRMGDGDESCISLVQHPGSFYVGNLCALSHNVEHGPHSHGSYGTGPPSKQMQIAIMIRSDLFREVRARKKNALPGPADLFRIVNTETAMHIAEGTFCLPDLAAVLLEASKDD